MRVAKPGSSALLAVIVLSGATISVPLNANPAGGGASDKDDIKVISTTGQIFILLLKVLW
jgi:hypothetical protein